MTSHPQPDPVASDPVGNLLTLLDIERLELNLFRGAGAEDAPRKRIFGGHVIAQALSAACRTVEGRACHSLHAYFIRPGDPSIPVIYEVDRARDGGSFTTRRVIAVQHGQQILNMAASFQIEEDSPEYQHPFPAGIPDPETLPPMAERRARIAPRLDPGLVDSFLAPSPIEMREVDPIDPVAPAPKPDGHAVWFRLARPAGGAPALQQCLLSYATDLALLGTAARPLGEWLMGPRLMPASLDHAIWFHRPVNFDDWLLYSMDAPFTGGARGFNRGMIYDRSGQLVASVAQEGLLRPVNRG